MGRLLLQIAATCATIFVGTICLCSTVGSAPNTQVRITQCNAKFYFKDDPFVISLSYVLTDLETVTPTLQGYDYRNISPYPNAFAYGHANCKQNLTRSDCTTCLGAAKTAMLSGCDGRVGARSVLHDCSMRYEQYPFSD